MNLDTLCLNCMDNDSGESTCPKCGSPLEISRTGAGQLPPRTLLRDQYLIGRVLGEGSFGITYLAFDTAMETKVSLQEYMPRGIAGRTPGQTTVQAVAPACQEQFEFGLDRFLDEARSLKKCCDNSNTVSNETVFRDNGTAYLVMEFLDGMTLAEFLLRRDRTMSFENAQRILMPAMDALSSLHDQGGLHGAVSPSSIFLCRTGAVELIGFGVARQALAKKTRSQALLKEGYAPEEQYRSSGAQCPCTDVYGMAATLYRVITGKVPPAALDRLAEDQLESPSQLGIAMPAAAERALMSALSVRAADRCQSVEEFRNGLMASSIAGVPLPPLPPLPPRPTSAPPPPPQAQSARSFTRLSLMKGRLSRPKRLVPVAVLALIALGSATAALHYRHIPADDSQVAGENPAAQTDADQPQPDQQQPQQPQDDTSSQQSDAGQPSEQQPAPEPVQPQPRAVRPLAAVPVAPPPAPVVPAPDPEPAVVAAAPTVVVPVPAVVPGYDHTLARAETLIVNGDYNETSDMLSHAIAANPARWQAYNSLAKLQLYYLDAPNDAFANYRAALARGGYASFGVRHDHGGEQFGITCSGWLNVFHGKASFVADDAAHTFAFAPVKDAKKNRFLGRVIGESGHAFHVRLMNNQNFNFAPTSSAPKAEADFIVSILGV